MNRRGFLGSILALGAAPAIVRADSLMRIVPREAIVLTPPVHDLTLITIAEFEERYLRPAMKNLAENMEWDLLGNLAAFDAATKASVGSTIRIRQPNRYTRVA